MVVGVSPHVTRTLRRSGLRGTRKSATVFNTVDVRRSRSAVDVRREFDAEDAELVVSVGRYVKEKNRRLLLESLALLGRRRRRLRALMISKGPLKAYLIAKARALGLGGIVTLTGERTDAMSITAACDVFALSSMWEGLPLTLLEAMTLRRPIVATAVGGIGDVLRDEH